MKLRQFAYGAMLGVAAIVLAIGSTSTAEAKKAKKEAAPASYGFCPLYARAPVCATKGGQKFTYANACFAAKDGAKGAKAGACKPPKKAKKSKKAKKKKKM